MQNYNRSTNIAVKTDYNNRRRNKNNRYFTKSNINNDELNNNKNNLERNYLNKNDKQFLNERQNQILNSQLFQKKMIPLLNYNNNFGERRHFKEINNYNDYITTTQITTLPGGVKRNKYEIKDDYYFQKPYNYSRLFKSVYDYNSNINFEENYDPITQGYNVNTFPTKERYYGSYKRGVKDNDIFNSKFYNKHKYLYDNFYD